MRILPPGSTPPASMTEQGEAESPAPDPFAEVRVIDSQLQHFSSYIDVIRVFKCRICSFCSPLEHVIASHMSEVHFPRRCFLCKQCLFVFEDRSQLKSHLESAHGTRSINVCFGESGPFVNSPPTWHAGVGRSSEDDEQLSRQSTEEQAESEPNNGRVTSSTGNLANLPDEGQLERDNSTSSLNVPTEGEFRRRIPSGGESHQEQVLSRASSCNPTTTDQDLSIISDPTHTPLVQQDSSSLEQTSRQGSEESPEHVPSETPKLNENHENYIKTEPVSPVQVFMCPKRRRLLQTSYSGDSIDNDAEARSTAVIHSEKSNSTKPQNDSELTQPDPPAEANDHRRSSISSVRSSDGSRRSDLRGLLQRQRTIEDIDSEMPSDPSNDSSPKEAPCIMPRSMSLTSNDMTTSGSLRNEALPRQSSEPVVRQLERHEEVLEPKKPDNEFQASEKNDRSDTGSKSMLYDMVSRTLSREKRPEQERRGSESIVLRKTGSIDETSSGQPALLSHRRRSHSLTDGDSRYPPAMNKDFHRPPEGSPEKDLPRPPLTYPLTRDNHPRLPSYWPRYPGGLVRQPYAVDGEQASIWPRMRTFPSQGSVQSEPPAPSRPTSEHGKGMLATQMSEDSFLLNCLRPNMGPRKKRNPAALSNQHSADGVPSSWVPPMIGFQGPPWQHYQRGMPHHMLIRQNADDKSASPTITSSTPHRLGYKPDVPMYHTLERSASQPISGERRFERRRAPMLGQVAASSESSQELAHAEDITRQVQKAISASEYYSTERQMVPWSDQSSGNNTSMEEQNGKDDFKKRSRKSTFNIYREIPERKRKLDRDEEERIKSSYNPDGSFDYFSLTGWKAYKCDLCKKRRFKTASELEEHKRRKHSLQHTHIGNASSSSSSGIGASLDDGSSSPQLTPQLSNG